MKFEASAPLGEVQAWLREQAAGDGARCPCCTQLTKVYRRSLNAGMARALIWMYRAAGTEWQKKTDTLRGIGAAARDEALLRYWGLLEERNGESGRRVGWWRVTEAGEAFVLGETRVPRHVLVFDGRCLGLDERAGTTSIFDALGDHFDYHVLMDSPAGVEPTG